jgi:hypothetical protein
MVAERGGLTRSFGGSGRSTGGEPGTAGSGKLIGWAGWIDAGLASPCSIESSLLVSRSIARTASHDDSAATSTVRLSASGVPAAKIAISGGLACPTPAPGAVNPARRSAWSAGMS